MNETPKRLVTYGVTLRPETGDRLVEFARLDRLRFAAFTRGILERYVARRDRTEQDKKRRTA